MRKSKCSGLKIVKNSPTILLDTLFVVCCFVLLLNIILVESELNDRLMSMKINAETL